MTVGRKLSVWRTMNRRLRKTPLKDRGEKRRGDWVIPFRCNFWFCVATVCAAVSIACAIGFVVFRSAAALLIWLFATSFAVIFFGVTQCGMGSIRGYRTARHYIEKNGEVETEVQQVLAGGLYCYRAGVRTAAADHGKQRHLNRRLANKWWPI